MEPQALRDHLIALHGFTHFVNAHTDIWLADYHALVHDRAHALVHKDRHLVFPHEHAYIDPEETERLRLRAVLERQQLDELP